MVRRVLAPPLAARRERAPHRPGWSCWDLLRATTASQSEPATTTMNSRRTALRRSFAPDGAANLAEPCPSRRATGSPPRRRSSPWCAVPPSMATGPSHRLRACFLASCFPRTLSNRSRGILAGDDQFAKGADHTSGRGQWAMANRPSGDRESKISPLTRIIHRRIPTRNASEGERPRRAACARPPSLAGASSSRAFLQLIAAVMLALRLGRVTRNPAWSAAVRPALLGFPGYNPTCNEPDLSRPQRHDPFAAGSG